MSEQDVLKTIVDHKRTEIREAEERVSRAELEARLSSAPPVRDFVQANEPAVPISPQEDRVAGGEFVFEVCEERVKDLSTRTDRRVANHVS
mgnify:CR=1 FL=1